MACLALNSGATMPAPQTLEGETDHSGTASRSGRGRGRDDGGEER